MYDGIGFLNTFSGTLVFNFESFKRSRLSNLEKRFIGSFGMQLSFVMLSPDFLVINVLVQRDSCVWLQLLKSLCCFPLGHVATEHMIDANALLQSIELFIQLIFESFDAVRIVLSNAI